MSSASEDYLDVCTYPSNSILHAHRLELCGHRWVATEKSTRIPVSMFHCSLRLSGNDVSVEEAECFVANMIYKGYMRGYISHEKQMVVLASTNAFPRLGERPSPYALL